MTETPKQTKNQRREEAREAARVQREKNLKRKKLLKWVIPTVSSVAILAIVAGVVWAVIAFQPPPKSEAGPQNMISDGILFEGVDGEIVPVETDAIAKGEEPVPTEAREGILNIQTFVDYTCPHCKTFEEAYGESINGLVADGQATLEVHPVAILGPNAVRPANVAACVANYAPESFLDVSDAIFASQGQGSSVEFYTDLVKAAGLDDEDVNSCIADSFFTPWVESATQRSGVSSTPTVYINGTQWDAQTTPEFADFVNAELAKLES